MSILLNMLIDAPLPPKTATSTNEMLGGLRAYGILAAAAVVILFPVIFTGEASFCIKQDNLHQTYPYFCKLAAAIHHGYLPVWDANTFGGKSFAGEIQPGIFYPLNLIWCLLFGNGTGISVYYIDLLTALHFAICLVGMYQLARTLGISQMAAIAAALVFSFTGPVAARAGGQTGIFFGLTLAPWSLLLTARYYLVRQRKIYLAGSGIFLGLQILAGHMQPFFHTVLLNAAFVVYYESQGRKTWRSCITRIAAIMGAMLLTAALIALPQLYYSAQYLSDVYRSVGPGGVLAAPGHSVPLDIYIYRHIINLHNLPNLLGQELAQPEDDNLMYMGILPLCLLILYLTRRRRLNLSLMHAHLTRLLLIILCFGAVCVLGYLTFIPYILHSLPFVSVVRQLGRYLIMVSFSTSLLVGLAISYLEPIRGWALKHSPDKKICFFGALSILALYWMLFQQQIIPIAVSIPFLCVSLFFMLWGKMETSELAVLALIVIGIDIYFNKPSYSPAANEYYADRQYGRNRIIDTLEQSYGKYRVAFDFSDYSLERRNLGDVYKIQTVWGYSATYNRSFLDLLNTDRRPDSWTGDLLNIKYVLSDKALGTEYILKESVGRVKLYEKTNFYPRVYWQRQLGMRGPEIEAANASTIRQLSYSDLEQKLDIDCLSADTLIISENCYPGWKCLDNQHEIPIRPARIGALPPLFRSVFLKKGHHVLEFRYNKVFHWF